jgi:hypothetical protein
METKKKFYLKQVKDKDVIAAANLIATNKKLEREVSFVYDIVSSDETTLEETSYQRSFFTKHFDLVFTRDKEPVLSFNEIQSMVFLYHKEYQAFLSSYKELSTSLFLLDVAKETPIYYFSSEEEFVNIVGNSVKDIYSFLIFCLNKSKVEFLNLKNAYLLISDF